MSKHYLTLIAVAALSCVFSFRILPAQLNLWALILLFVSAAALCLSIVTNASRYYRREALGMDCHDNCWYYLRLARHRERLVLVDWGYFCEDDLTGISANFRAWRELPLYSACPGRRLLLRSLELPHTADKNGTRLLDYELGYQYPWLDDSWIRTEGVVEASEAESPMRRVSLVLLKREEYHNQLERLRRLELYPRRLELRASAVWRCIRQLGEEIAPVLMLEFNTEDVCCIVFDNNIMRVHLVVPMNELVASAVEFADQARLPFDLLVVYGRAVPSPKQLLLLVQQLRDARALNEETRVWTGEEIVEAILGVSTLQTPCASQLLAPLGLALRGGTHGI